MTDDHIILAVFFLCEAVLLALMVFIVQVKHLDKLDNWLKEELIRFYGEVYRLKHDKKRNKRANRHITSPPDAILQGGKSDIDGTKLRDRRIEVDPRKPERRSEHDSVP